jgi:hypothetical protein
MWRSDVYHLELIRHVGLHVGDLSTREFVDLFVEIPCIIRMIRRKQCNYIPKQH